MSTHVLNEHKDQFPYQLTGRLWMNRDKPGIAPFWKQAQVSGELELLETQAYPPMLQASGALLRTLAGHTDEVWGALALSDGRLLSWSRDKTLRLWDGDGNALATLTGHMGSVYGALALSDGRLLSWSRDNNLWLWDANGNALAVLAGHTQGLLGALALSNGRLLSWSADDILRLWDGDGNALVVLEDWEQDEDARMMWAQTQNIDVRVLYGLIYETDSEGPDSAFARRAGYHLFVYNVGQFIGDAEFKALAVHGKTVVAGDSAGRAIFLCVRGGGDKT